MGAVATLLGCKATMVLRRITDLRWNAVARNFSALVIAGGFAIGMFLLVRMVTGVFLVRIRVPLIDLYQAVSLVMLLFYLSIHLINLVVAYATLYNADELPFLFSLPISFEEIFTARLVENFLTSSGMLTLIALASLLGFWSYFGLSWYLYFAAMFLAFLPFVLIAATMAVVLLTVLILLAYRIGVRWMLVVAGLSYVGGTYTIFTLAQPLKFMEQLLRQHPVELSGETGPGHWLFRMFPHDWLAKFLQHASQGSLLAGLPYVGALFITLLLLLWGARKFAMRYYYDSWRMAAELRSRTYTSSRTTLFPLMNFGRPSRLPAQVISLLKRDFWMFVRDPIQRLHLLMMGILIITFVWSLQAVESPSLLPGTRTAGILILYLFNGFLLASLALRFVFPAVSMEGAAFWSVRVSPVSLARLYWLKFAIATLFIVTVGEGLAIAALPVISFHPSAAWLFSGATALMGLGITSVNIGAGAYFAALKESNPLRVASSQGASLTFLATIVYLLLMSAALVFPIQQYAGLQGGSAPASFQGLLAAGVMTGFTVCLSAALHIVGIRSIHRDL
jgi:ABC-2 type transport system permease protein